MLTGIAWYRRKDYDRLKSMFTDADRLSDTYDEWLDNAERLYDILAERGIEVVKAYIDPKTFPAWCRAREKQLDAAGRMAYGQEYAVNKARMRGKKRTR